MIQRIQSIYLLLTTALMAVFLFLPIAQFDTTDGIYSFTAQGISTVEAMTTPVQDSAAAVTQTSVFTPTWGVFVLGTVIAVLSFITIFLYKNRPTQARICMIDAFFLVTFYIVIFLSGYTFREDLSASNISWTAYIVMPFIALILDSFPAIMLGSLLGGLASMLVQIYFLPYYTLSECGFYLRATAPEEPPRQDRSSYTPEF